MARISGVDIPWEKRVVVSLTYLHGIGRTVAENICEKMKRPCITVLQCDIYNPKYMDYADKEE